MTIKCYDFFRCYKKQKCPMANDHEERNCWDIEPALTPCTDMLGEGVTVNEKIFFCRNCLFYEHINKASRYQPN